MSGLDYCLHIDLNLIEVRPAGVVGISDILSYAREALSREILTEGTVEYYDLSAMTGLDADYESAYAFAGTLGEWLRRGWEGSVFFTPQDYQFGMIRMIGTIVETIPDSPGVIMIPSREPVALGGVRALLAERKQTS